MGNREDIWYATNIEIYEYVAAFKHLVISLDGKRVQNPTGYTLHFELDGKAYVVQAGETIVVD